MAEGGQDRTEDGARGSLVGWLLDQELLRGPFLHVDYWSSVLDLAVEDPRREREGLVDQDLFRVGLDRPDLEVPRLRHYLLLFLLGPLLLPFRSFRRLGRYNLTFRSEIGDEILRRLQAFRLELEERGNRRVDVRKGGRTLATDVLHPQFVSGFSSLFYATYKLPLASLAAVVVAVAAVPVREALGGMFSGPAWLPVAYLLMVGALFAVFRDWVTAVLGALPVVAVRLLLPHLWPAAGTVAGWVEFGAALAGLLLVYLLVDWFFMPRPVPPVLMLYTREGPGRTYEREEDAPWWLEGEAYWVWRYLMLTPAELNKFWERDWERVELWVRADGEEAGRLEWVVTDGHYRELWIPYEKLGRRERLDRQEEALAEARREGRAGFWLLEVDADLVFHTPFLRAVSFVPDEERVPARSAAHLASALWKQAEADDPDRFGPELERIQLRRGTDLFRDAPEVATPWVARHLLSQPWRYWRYPLGAATRRADRLYGDRDAGERPPAADPGLQIKESTGDLS